MSNADPVSEAAYNEMRELCLADPLAVRRQLVALIESQDPLFEKIVERAGGPGDGRLRQIIARSLQRRPEARMFSSQLREWRVRETDEFTISAIEDTLIDAPSPSRRSRRLAEPEDLAATYRYLSGRLRHRVLNAMPRAGLNIEQVRMDLLQSGVAGVEKILRQLDEVSDSLRAVESAVDFEDESVMFERQAIDLAQWLRALALRYQKSFPGVSVRVDGDQSATTVATKFLLETIFWNLWDNSRQAVAGQCCIILVVRVNRRTISVQILDNGPGMISADAERAFQLQYSSTRRPGRGHMEVADAIRRLGGTATVREVASAGYRVVLTFQRGEV